MRVAEPRAPENVHDPGENVRDVHDDARGPLRQRQSFPQQHARGGRRPVHQRSAELAGARGESYIITRYNIFRIILLTKSVDSTRKIFLIDQLRFRALPPYVCAIVIVNAVCFDYGVFKLF